MKNITALTFIITLLFTGIQKANAEYYIVDQQGKVIVQCNYEPDPEDLATRGEISVYSETLIPLSKAEYVNGQIIEHIPTQEELDAEKEERKMSLARAMVDRENKITAVDVLVQEGKLWAPAVKAELEAELLDLEAQYAALITE